MLRNLFILLSILCANLVMNAVPIKSIDTKYTILNVRNLTVKGQNLIVGSSYEGTLVCYDFNGKKLWENKLSGFMNNDIYCGDLNGDKSDEILVANATGALYCLDSKGKQLWQFKANNAPMNSVCIIHKDNKPYIACGGYDMNLYYLDAKGKEISEVKSSSYTLEKGMGVGAPAQGFKAHIANFLKPLKRKDGSEILAMHGTINSMASNGTIYLFEPLANKPYKTKPTKSQRTIYGSASVNDIDGDGTDKLILGSSKDTRDGFLLEYNPETDATKEVALHKIAKNQLGTFGYRVAQCAVTTIGGVKKYVALFGSNILVLNDDCSAKGAEILSCKYSFYDIIKDNSGSKIILASAQSGGSCIHIIDLNDKSWTKAYCDLQPIGKITQILDNTSLARTELSHFKLPKWEKLNSRPVVCFMSESPEKYGNDYVKDIVTSIHNKYQSPIFLNGGKSGGSEDPKLWNREAMENEFYRDRRDKRQTYKNNQEDILKNVAKSYVGDSKGMSMWGGHGNDPFYYSPETTKKILEMTGDNQQTVLIYPEMESRGKDAEWLMDNLLYPLADVAHKHNSKLYIRSKHVFWLGNIYEKHWGKLVSGEYADVFVPSMEETTDKSMDLGLAGRLGIWMSGAVNSWGSRCARDNTSFNRLRQFSHQNLPNHFLRNMIYYISYGSQYLDNFPVDQKYMSILWDMIAKGALYVPKRNEIVSINPVRVTMLEPDQDWLDEGNNVKWVCMYNKEKEDTTSYFAGHLNGTWPGAPVQEWDFSRYAAGTNERRLNFVSSYNNGMVLIAPPYDAKAPRGKMSQYMHPMYKGKTKEFFTDGKYYYSDAKKSIKYTAPEYYKTVENAIIEGAKMLPVTVKGEAGWVVAQSAPRHLRLTLVDGGYINPSDKTVTVKIGNIKVKSIHDLLTGETIVPTTSNEVSISIPCGLFRFLDIELLEDFK